MPVAVGDVFASVVVAVAIVELLLLLKASSGSCVEANHCHATAVVVAA